MHMELVIVLSITLVGLGHLTNVALAAKMHPTFSSKLKSLYIMGGNMDDFLRAKGDVKVFGAFNFFTDPEAASIVLSHFTCPIYIATLEYCFRHRLPWGTNQDSAKTQSTKKVAAQTADSSQESQSSKGMQSASGFVSYDSYAMSAAIDDSLVTERAQYGVSVELHGSLTRGMMVVDTLDILKLQHKATVFLECDMEKLKQLMIKVQ
ncbi:nucleoside hydrolase-like [Rhinoraja longicauda]